MEATTRACLVSLDANIRLPNDLIPECCERSGCGYWICPSRKGERIGAQGLYVPIRRGGCQLGRRESKISNRVRSRVGDCDRVLTGAPGVTVAVAILGDGEGEGGGWAGEKGREWGMIHTRKRWHSKNRQNAL